MGKTVWPSEQSSMVPMSKSHLKSRGATELSERVCACEGGKGDFLADGKLWQASFKQLESSL